MNSKKVGIITWHYFPNFGSALQAYSLQENIARLGYDVKVINYRSRKYCCPNLYKDFIKSALYILFGSFSKKLKRKCSLPFSRFQKRFFNETALEQNEERLGKLCDEFDVIVCGSDQIWAPNVFNPIYMLNFVPDYIKKISYAASIGLNDINDELVKIYRSLLGEFKSISVREEAGAALLKEKCDVQATVVLDPTLLLESEHWQKLENKCLSADEKYIFCYFLNKNHKYKDIVLKYAKKENLKLIGYSLNTDDKVWLKTPERKIGPQEFLWLIHNASAVFTDSYHGTIFSLLYNKDFITFKRFDDEDEICQNSRIYQLDRYFGISNRIIDAEKCDNLVIEKYDYYKFQEKASLLREKSVEFLKKSLEM